jgi:hypothetical protein
MFHVLVDPIPGAIIGAALTGLIAVVVWALAYYGDINLHLPSRPGPLSFQAVDAYVQANLPKNYSFSTDEIENFRGTGNPTILVWANSEGPSLLKPGHRREDGILLFLDQDASGKFRIDFRFEPLAPANYPEPVGFPRDTSDNFAYSYYVTRPVVADLVGDGSDEVIAQWTALTAAGLNPFIGFIFGVQQGSIHIEPLNANPLSDPAAKNIPYVEAYRDILIRNVFHPSEQWSARPYRLLGLGNGGTLYALYRTDQACDFCDHSYLAQPYSHDPLGFAGFAAPDRTEQFSSLENAQIKMQIIGSEVPTG